MGLEMEENEGRSLLFVPGQCELPWYKLRCSASCPGEYPPLPSNRGAELEENEGRLLLLVLRAVRAALAQAQVVPVAVPAALVNIHLCHLAVSISFGWQLQWCTRATHCLTFASPTARGRCDSRRTLNSVCGCRKH